MNSYTDDEIEKACWNYVWAQTEWGVRFDLYKLGQAKDNLMHL